MIPPVAAFVLALGFLARRHNWELSPRDARLNEALATCHGEAIALGTVPDDEPAAIFFAFSRVHYLFGDDYLLLPITMSANHAEAAGRKLRASRAELVDQARWISAGLVSYEQLRAWFAERRTPAAPPP